MKLTYDADRLQAFFLTSEVVRKEATRLRQTHTRIFVEPIDTEWVRRIDSDEDLAERVEAFVSRFGRLQDTLGEKLLPKMAALAGHRATAMIELLATSEKLGWIVSADQWLSWRKLRNRLVHEYVTDPAEFAMALNEADKAALDLLDAEKRIREHAVRLEMLNT